MRVMLRCKRTSIAIHGDVGRLAEEYLKRPQHLCMACQSRGLGWLWQDEVGLRLR